MVSLSHFQLGRLKRNKKEIRLSFETQNVSMWHRCPQLCMCQCYTDAPIFVCVSVTQMPPSLYVSVLHRCPHLCMCQCYTDAPIFVCVSVTQMPPSLYVSVLHRCPHLCMWEKVLVWDGTGCYMFPHWKWRGHKKCQKTRSLLIELRHEISNNLTFWQV